MRTLWREQRTEGLWSPFIHKLVDLLSWDPDRFEKLESPFTVVCASGAQEGR